MQPQNAFADRLELALLGPPEVRRDGEPVRLRTRKALALLTFLALEGGMQPRARLTALFWPEFAETQGRSNLRNTVSYLRETLGDHFVVARDALGLRDGFTLDFFALEAAGRAGEVQASELNPGHADLEKRELEQAIQAYRGDFLEAFSLPDAPGFDDWVAAQREVARQWLDGALERLLGVHHAQGDLEAALDLAKRRLRRTGRVVRLCSASWALSRATKRKSWPCGCGKARARKANWVVRRNKPNLKLEQVPYRCSTG
jgi:DNA-binding SARP family transcriptional activator